MASEVNICNLALSHIGARSIQSLTENIKEARECSVLYPIARDAVLADHKWSFATKRLVLALLSDTYSGWDYAYTFPIDCLTAHEIYDQYGNYSGIVYESERDDYIQGGKVEFEVSANDNLTGRIILTNKDAAELIYTAKVEDANLFSPQFVDALSWRLASDLAMPIKANSQLQQGLLQWYGAVVGEARSISSNEGYSKPRQDNSFVNSRL